VGLKPIKIAYDPMLAGWPVDSTARPFVSMPTVPTVTQNIAVSSTAVAVTHCAYPRRNGQAELVWVARYIPILAYLQAATHLGTNNTRFDVE